MKAGLIVAAVFLFIAGQCARVGGEFREFVVCTLAACALLALAGLAVLGGA